MVKWLLHPKLENNEFTRYKYLEQLSNSYEAKDIHIVILCVHVYEHNQG